MPAQTRPADTITADNLFIGLPIVEFTPVVAGVPQQAVELGILDSSALAKELDLIALEDASSGVRVTVTELITKIDPELNVGVFNFAASILRYTMGSATSVEISADAAATVTNESIVTTTDPEDFLGLANGELTAASVTVTASPVTLEVVGTGDGTSGDASGDFTLDYKVAAVGDIGATALTVAGVVYTPIAVAAAAAGNEVEVVVGTGATSGDLQFFVGGIAADVTGEILATYTPSHTLTEDTQATAGADYLIDYKNGRIAVWHEATKATGTQVIIAGQSVDVDYTYNRLAHTELQPFTQLITAGKARIRHLPDVGSNWIWDVPSAEIQVTDDDLTWDDENFAVGNVTLKILDAGGSQRFGTLQVFDRAQAGNAN